MNNKLKNKNLDALMTAILSLKTIDECYDFFDDLCTVHELKAMEQRYEVAYLLYEGKVYGNVVSDTGASTATISRVNRSLNYGSDGYRMVFERLKAEGIDPGKGRRE